MSRSADTPPTRTPETPAQHADGAQPRLTVYFDGSCPICRAEIAHYARQTGADRLVFVDVATSAAVLPPDLSVPQAMARFHVRLPDGRLISGARAFRAIWHTLPRWRWAARLAHCPGMIQVLEAGYRIFLPLRPTLSRMARRLAGPQAAACACAGQDR